jgi:hypothetical protein
LSAASSSRSSSSDVAVSDIYRLAETGWFDQFPIKLDHRFEDSFARSLPANFARDLAKVP